MTAEDHIVAWIGSSRPHYDRLLKLSEQCNAPGGGSIKAAVILEKASRLVADAYCEMIRGGDASRDDPYSATDLVKAVVLVVAWELEQ